MMIQFSKMFKSTMYGNEYVALSVLHYVNSTIIDPASCYIKHVITVKWGKEKKRKRRKWRKRWKLIINITFVMNKIVFSKVVYVYKAVDRKSWMFNKKWGG